MRARIQSAATTLLDTLDGDVEIDFMREIATPLPVMVIGDILGFPGSDTDQIHRWAVASAAMFEPTLSDADHQRARAAVLEFSYYIDDVVKERRARRRDDLISALIDVQDAGNTLDPNELRSMIHLLFTAGNHTTTGLLGNAVGLLLDTPGIWQSLVRTPHHALAAVEEVLRLEPSIVAGLRITKADVELGDETIPAGEVVLLLNASANRDPRIIDRPDEMSLDRPASPHIAFGAGAHFCLGAGLARLEAQIVLKLLIMRAPGMRRGDAASERLPYVFSRQYHSLPVRL
jgi:cytochrome P450